MGLVKESAQEVLKEAMQLLLRGKGWEVSGEATFWCGQEMWFCPDDEDRATVYTLGAAYVEQLEREM